MAPAAQASYPAGVLVIPFRTTVDVLGATHVESPTSSSPTPPQSGNRWVGASLDHFEVQRALGRGGMGEVYLARDRSLDRLVAIKVLPDELAGQAELQQRFVREAQAQARLSSPHVVAIYFIGRTSNPSSLYFAMEYVEGESLEATIESGQPLDPETARRWMVDVVRGLRDAHRAGIVHRDIKPSNLLRDAHGTVKLVDFGLAKPIDDGDKKITRDGVLLGSPLYLSPEQARGDAVDHRADMYSLGCTFYHLLKGSPAFDGPTPLAVVTRHVADPPPRVREQLPHAPPALAAIVQRLLSKTPADRYATHDELLAALDAAAPETTELAGFWTRGAALIFDGSLTLALLVVCGLLSQLWVGVVLLLVYMTALHATTGQTLGKFLLRIRVVSLTGGALGWQRAILRTVASLWMPGVVALLLTAISVLERLSGRFAATYQEELLPVRVGMSAGTGLLVLLYSGGLMLAAFQRDKRAFHDLFAGSRVVYQMRRPALLSPRRRAPS